MKRSLLLFSMVTVLLTSCQLDSLCDNGKHLDEEGNCVDDPDLPRECGFPAKDCLAMPGVVYADCNRGTCVAQVCAEGFSLNSKYECVYGESHTCESDSDCELLSNALSMTCDDNQCKITECEADYKLVGNTCTPSILDYCLEDSDCDIPDAKSVCTDNQCTIAECNEGYVQVDDKCFSTDSPSVELACSSDEDCGLPHALTHECKNGSYCSATECEEEYELKQYSANEGVVIDFCTRPEQMPCIFDNDCTDLPDGTVSLKCDEFVCTATECVDGYRVEINGDSCVEIVAHECIEDGDCLVDDEAALEAVCEENICKYTACVDDYHIKNDVCVNDSASECGGIGPEFDCNAKKGFSPGHVQCVSTQCEATECETGYTLFESKCIEDSIFSCDGLNCAELDGTIVDHINCIEGMCIADKCEVGYHLLTGICFKDSDIECGNRHLDCTQDPISISHCIDGECVSTGCETGYHVADKVCVSDSNEACGTEVVNCIQIENVSRARCEQGNCIIEECAIGSHLKENQCVADTPTECGASQINCDEALKDAATTICEGGVCKATACKSNFHLKENQCVADSPTECGASLTNCDSTIANASKRVCDGGVCKAAACNGNFHLKGDQCVADSPTECGASMTNCDSTIANASKRACEGGACKATACIANFHIKGNQCAADSATECGSNLVNCNSIDGVKTGSCSGGACSASECKSSYRLEDGYCCFDGSVELTQTTEERTFACVTGNIRIPSTVRTLKLPNLVKIGGQLTTSGESYLATLEVPKLHTVNGGIWITNSASLKELSLPNLKKIDDGRHLYISSNQKLTKISIPNTISGKLNNVEINNNAVLESLQLNTTSSYLYIISNPKLSCQALCGGTPQITADRANVYNNKDDSCKVQNSSSGQLHDKCGN